MAKMASIYNFRNFILKKQLMISHKLEPKSINIHYLALCSCECKETGKKIYKHKRTFNFFFNYFECVAQLKYFYPIL
jgi:hypothetical protein